MINISGFNFAYEGGAQVLCGVDFELKSAQIAAILGRSGSGKSTLLREILLANLEFVEGSEALSEQAIERLKIKFSQKRRLAYMPQNALLLEHLSALENAALAQIFAGIPRDEALQNAKKVFKSLQLEPLALKLPAELSGGEAQRVALARTLLQNAPLVLLDEPFAALDYFNKLSLRKLLREQLKTAILITHDVEDALELADEIYLLKDARLQQIATRDKEEILKLI